MESFVSNDDADGVEWWLVVGGRAGSERLTLKNRLKPLLAPVELASG